MNSEKIENFVTLFDKNFLIQGICLYKSLQRVGEPFCLWIICLDTYSFDVLSRLNLSHAKLINFSDHKTRELKKIESERTKAEFCWTITPLAPILVQENEPSIERVTYLDADLWFLKSFRPIFEEFEQSKKEVLITPHYYSPTYDQSATSGFFCVQFVTFSKESISQVASDWFRNCVEWCYNRFEDGKFGDQRYLEKWPQDYPNRVCVLSNRRAILAPWNAQTLAYSEAIACHFHGFKFWGNNYDAGNYNIPHPTIEFVYELYFTEIKNVISELKANGKAIFYPPKLNIFNRIKRKIKKF